MLSDIKDIVEEVGRIRLIGAPHELVIDELALLTPDGQVPHSLKEKLRVLTSDGGMHLTILSMNPKKIAQLLAGVDHQVSPPDEAPMDRYVPTLVIVGALVPAPDGASAWYVGDGHAPPGFQSMRARGPRGTDAVLGLFGTALLQERAGIAFRAASSGAPIPQAVDFDTRILTGIATALSTDTLQVESLKRREYRSFDLDDETDDLIRMAIPAILASQAPNGAIAGAAPPRDRHEPDYWFFWQRDAGQVVTAMARLMKESPDSGTRDVARSFVNKYVDFVEALPRRPDVATIDLGISRFTIEGHPIRAYGNPQNDGPAYTVLALANVLEDSLRAYAASRPYLEYLSRHDFDVSFDPWEFAVGEIFADLHLARKALSTGVRLARVHGDVQAAEEYEVRTSEIDARLDRFVDRHRGYILSGRDFLQPWMGAISALDVDVVGSVLAPYDSYDSYVRIDDPLLYGTVRRLEGAFAERWPVNVAWRAMGHEGMGIGRFPEDANDGKGSTGGNPWTLATLWTAEYYLRLAERGRAPDSAARSSEARARLIEKADGYLQFLLNHVSAAALTEQIDGQTGKPRGARNLAWAQAQFVHALLLRRQVRRMPEACA